MSKNKILCLSTLLLSTSIVYPLVSCGNDGSTNDIGGFDKEFGFDVQTYNRLESEFRIRYCNALLDNFDKDIVKNKITNFLNNDITLIRNKLFDPAQNYSFTIRTNTLIDYAAKNYNIYLNRHTNIGETDFDNLRQSSIANFTNYINNLHYIDESEKQLQIVEFSNRFDELLATCISKYNNDNAQVLMQLRAGIIDCWGGLNYDFAYLSAYNHLKDFFDNHKFVINDQTDNQNMDSELYWNNLLTNEEFITNGKTGLIDQDIDCPISEEWINKLFTIYKENEYDENNPIKVDDEKPIYEVTEKYRKEIIPGYTLTPVLKSMTQDIYANNYYINIDWQLISNKYKNETDQAIKDKVTAHLAYSKNEQAIDDKINDEQLSSNDYDFIKYSLLAAPNYQKQNLAKAYFDDEKEQKITFSWDMQKIGIENFLPSDAYEKVFAIPEDSYEVPMDQGKLVEIGLQLNGTNLSVLIDKQKKSQDNQTMDTENNDDNLKIEEKFVKYCNVSAISSVKFDKDIQNNAIENTFIASFKNTKQEHKISANQEESELKNITTSSAFNDNAVKFYDSVANYINTQKIEDSFVTSDLLAHSVWVELGIMAIVIIIWIVLVIKQALYPDYWSNESVLNKLHEKHPIKSLIIIFALIMVLLTTWYYFIYLPLHKQLAKIKDWNKAFANGLADKINVVKKVNSDKKYFNSSNDFDKYFHTNGSDAFAKYFYYLHFNKFTNDSSDNLNDEVIKDYTDFEKTKEKYKVSPTSYSLANIASIIIFIIVIIFLIKKLVVIWDDALKILPNLKRDAKMRIYPSFDDFHEFFQQNF